MNGFYMGFDAGSYPLAKIDDLAKKLISSGLYAAGYQTIRLGKRGEEDKEALIGLCRQLQALGFQIDITLCKDSVALAGEVGAQMVTFIAGERDAVCEAAAAARDAGVRRVCVRTDDETDLDWAAKIADVVELSVISAGDDFFDITRDRMDSCRDGDVDIERSTANLRRGKLLPGGRYQLGALPIRFDDERNYAILCAYAVLGCPLVIANDPDELSAATLEHLKSQKTIEVAAAGVGGVIRYHDPWHVLFGKMKDEKSGWMLIFNRCHGDKPGDIVAQDFGWDTSFELLSVRTGELAAQKVRRFDAYVESSDYPLNPCCQLYLGNQKP